MPVAIDSSPEGALFKASGKAKRRRLGFVPASPDWNARWHRTREPRPEIGHNGEIWSSSGKTKNGLLKKASWSGAQATSPRTQARNDMQLYHRPNVYLKFDM